MCFEWGNLTLLNDLYFQMSPSQNNLINLDLFRKNENGYFVPYFDEVWASQIVNEPTITVMLVSIPIFNTLSVDFIYGDIRGNL